MERSPERRAPQQYIELEGTAVLAKDQNFYDQQPFVAIIGNASKEKSWSVDVLRHVLTSIVNNLAEDNPGVDKNFVKYHTINNCAKAGYLYVRKHGTTGDFSGANLRETMSGIVRTLDAFPQWEEYVSAKMEGELYKKNGQPKEVLGNWPEVPTYLEWFERKVKRDERIEQKIISTVLEETFPQDLAQQSLSDVLSSQGGRPVRKKWRMITASGLTKKR